MVEFYGQDRKEYVSACLLSALIQVPFLFFLSEVLDDGCQISSHLVTLMLSVLQLVAMSMYLWLKGISVRDVSSEAVSLLAVRSILYCVSFTAFVYSLRGLNPVSALLALHCGLY